MRTIAAFEGCPSLSLFVVFFLSKLNVMFLGTKSRIMWCCVRHCEELVGRDEERNTILQRCECGCQVGSSERAPLFRRTSFAVNDIPRAAVSWSDIIPSHERELGRGKGHWVLPWPCVSSPFPPLIIRILPRYSRQISGATLWHTVMMEGIWGESYLRAGHTTQALLL